MRLEDVKAHWRRSARTFKTGLRATTKTSTIKELEIDALYRAIQKSGYAQKSAAILEVGCGNGHNLFALSKRLPSARFTGIDFAPEMIEHAEKIHKRSFRRSAIRFQVGDILHLEKKPPFYDIVFTDRCLINLNTLKLQLAAFDRLTGKIRRGGFLILLENPRENYRRLDERRKAVGLPSKKVPAYNLLVDEKALLRHASIRSMALKAVDDFGSFHDLVLYVLTPLSNQGEVRYDHPMVQAATKFTLAGGHRDAAVLGPVGQNRLYLFQKR